MVKLAEILLWLPNILNPPKWLSFWKFHGFSRATTRRPTLPSSFCSSHGKIPPISHLHYADDSVFFINLSWEELCNLMSILKCIEAVSELRVNPSKTKLIQVGQVPDLHQWAANIGCTTEALPFIYLGMPLGAKSKAKTLWDPIVEKFDSMLASWMKGFITRAGRITLVKSVLSSLVIFYFSVFLAPVAVIKSLEKIMRKFIWDSGGTKQIHLVNWEELCKPLKLGGLGIKSIRMMNKSLLEKWVWRFGEESHSLWHRIIRDKYGGPQSVWTPKIPSSPYGYSVWKHITSHAHLVTSLSKISIGDGCTISFWLDCWGSVECLKNMFPALYKIAGLKHGFFKDHVSPDGSSWSFHFKRLLKEAEVNQLASMLTVIGDCAPQLSDHPDSRTWRPTPTGNFSVKSTYNSLMELVQSPLVPNFPYKTIWNPHVPPKINLLFWTASLSKISTQDSLQRRNFKLASRCPLCLSHCESTEHLLLSCQFACKVWSLILPSHSSWIPPLSILQLAQTWSSNTITGPAKLI
ncbi:hypothetical protein C5167_041467 [Papaver somniferum]|nr:hypothetical protein C5167_041467 [Papaver somniferum]